MQSLGCFTPQLLSGLRGFGSSWSRTATWVSPVQCLQGFLDFGRVATPESPDGLFIRQGSTECLAHLRLVTENLRDVFRAENASCVAVRDHAKHFFQRQPKLIS